MENMCPDFTQSGIRFNGNVYVILEMAIEVTERVKALNELQKANSFTATWPKNLKQES